MAQAVPLYSGTNMAPKVVTTQNAKQGRRGTHAFWILSVGLALAVIAFVAFMLWRPSAPVVTSDHPPQSSTANP